MKPTSLLFLRVLLVLGAGSRLAAAEFDSNGVKIHYEVSGAGEPVILIHGLFSNARMNWDLPGITRELAAHYQVIALDNRGHGQSGKPEEDDKYGVEMAEDVVRLMDHLKIGQAAVVGYSLGGMITMKLLTRHPERVKFAVLGGMGWFKGDLNLPPFLESRTTNSGGQVPHACLRGMRKLGVTEPEVKAIRVRVEIITGELDPCRRLYVEPLDRIRPDWPDHVIKGAGHILCVVAPEFRKQLLASLEKALPPPVK